ncbi:MAG: ATP-dependent Clp protease ATP-binding subunit [Oscillospiraceae bacterium]|nr:ATP-dependent Clp protease ATP-binding subunit [Oscillospiraceae bacterium]
MTCVRCKKRLAVVFVTRTEGDKTINEGLCLQCARELGLKPVDDIMQQMGISDDDLESMADQLSPMIGEDGLADAEGMANTFPFLQGLFSKGPGGEGAPADTPADSKKKKGEKDKAPKRKFLESYCTDLTKKAAEGKLDRIIGRDREIYRVIQILSRRTKNNPCLIGEPGVGKTAVAEGIALRICDGNVPPKLMGKELFLLDLTALVAGTQFRGQFEARIKGLVDEVRQAGNIILFIDEVHNLVGAGDSEGSMSAANILKPALSRGEIQVIGATTFAEYRKYIEKDSALERRFQPVTVKEPTIEETVEVLMGIKEYYESFHNVQVSPAVARLAAVLSERYITDRFLPDKAIDLLDEACAAASLKNVALTDFYKTQQLLDGLKKEETDLTANAEGTDFERLAIVRSDILRLTEENEARRPAAFGARVTEEDLAAVVELWTGIPASRIQELELKRVAGLDQILKTHIIGQDEAVAVVSAAIKRSRAQISARRRPATFLFVGPTGVGKTELVKVLAKELFDDTDPLIRLDMSEFMEKHSVSRIIGAPPGYVGYDEAGQLTEKVRRKPYSVVLFDEIEKAHPDVLNILLQIMDEGKVTDAHGRTVSFENTVIVMTSNAGSQFRDSGMGFAKSAGEISTEKAMKALRDFLRPEFLSRVDEIVHFQPLSEESYAKIACLMLDELKAPMEEKGISFGYSPEAATLLAQKIGKGSQGARELRRVIRREVEDPIAELLVERYADPPAILKVTAQEGEIRLQTI